MRAVREVVASINSLVTFEPVHENPDVLVVTSGWPRPDNPSHCVFIRRQMDSLAECGVRYETMFIHGYRSSLAYLVASLKLAALNFRGRRYRLVHAHGGEAVLAACFYRKAPLLASYLGGDILGNSVRPDARITLGQRLRRSIIRRSAHVASATITKSSEMERALPGSARKRNTVIPNGVDINLFRPVEREVARGLLGWDQDERIALFVGNPAELRKRYELAEAGVAEAQRTLGDIRLAVAHRVDPDLTPTYMNGADCLIHLSWMEGSPNVVKEALMCNLPVVATPVGDIPELLRGVEPSFVVQPACESVAHAIVSCLRSPRRSNGRTRSARLASDAIAREVMTVYERLATVQQRN